MVGLDSYSDVTVASRSITYNIRKITESVSTGAGPSEYHEEEGLVDISDGLYSFRTVPALVAFSPHHLPSSCALLLGVPQLNELDICVDIHRKQRRLPLQSYNPDIQLAAPIHLECRLSEKDLVTWAAHNADKPVGFTRYSHLDVDINPAFTAQQIQQHRDVTAQHLSVFDASAGAIPTLADHPSVTLNFKDDWRHVSSRNRAGVRMPLPS
jgi:hypothetical protein